MLGEKLVPSPENSDRTSSYIIPTKNVNTQITFIQTWTLL